MNASWKTTVFGLAAAIGGSVLAGLQTGMIDATTLPPWVKGVAGLLSVIGTAGLGLFARDNNVTSEQAGAGSSSGSIGKGLNLLLVWLTIAAVSVLPILVMVLITGCGTLAPGGAYSPAVTNADGSITLTQAPDPGLYHADATFSLLQAQMDAAFQFERRNRDMLWRISPDIKHSLDAIRPDAVQAVKTYGLARKAYMASPSPANLTVLQTALGRGQSLEAAAAAAVSANITNIVTQPK